MPGSCRRLNSRRPGQRGRLECLRDCLPFYFGVAIQNHVAEIGKQFGRSIASGWQAKEFRRIVEERRGDFPGLKLRVVHHVFQKRNVGFDAANSEFAQRPVHPLARFRKMCTPRRDFDEQRIVVRGEHGAGIGRSPVKANAEARRRPIRRKLPVVRRKVVCRVLGGHAALQGSAVQRHRFLLRQRKRCFVQLVTLCDQNLRAHQVDAGHHFRDRVLHLNTRIHLDEIPVSRIHVVEKFHRARIAIAGFARQFDCRVAKLRANAGGEVCGGRNLDNLLVAPLYGAIAFVKMQQVAMMIAKDLHLEMPRARQILFQEHGSVSESRVRFTTGFFEQRIELRGVGNHAHAAAAAAHGRLHNHRVADFLRNLSCLRS